MHLRRIFLLCLLSVALVTANASTESAEADDEDSTEPAVVLPADDSTTEKMSNVGDDAADPPQVPVAVKAVKIGGEGEEGDDDDDDEGDDGGEEEGCDMRLSSVVRNIDGSPFLPDDYEAAYESVTKTDWANKHYNITDMMAIIQSVIDHGVKVSKNKDLADTAMYVSSVMMDRLYDAKVSAECTADLANIGSSLRSGQLWPVKFLDSMAMPPSGMMTVHISALGEYDQCLGIRSPVLENGRRIYGQYCQMEARSIIPKTKTSTRYAETVFLDNTYVRQALEFIRSQMKMSNFLDEEAYLVRMMKEMLDWIDKDVCFFHVGLCVPASCSPQELEMVINQIIYPILKLPFRIAYCEKHPDITETKLDRVQWIAIIVLGAVLTLALISTLYHLYLICVRDPKSVQKVLLKSSGTSANTNDNKESCSKSSGVNLCLNLEGSRAELKPVRSICQQFAITFSVVHNTKKLLSPERTSFMGLVHAVQLLFTFLLFASQSFTFGLLVTPQLLRNWVNTVPYQLVSDDRYWFARMPSVWVDGLVFITGVSIVLRQAEFFQTHSSRSFGYFAYFWRHWFRNSVPMFGALLLLFLLPLTGNGPFFYLNRNWLWPACTRTPSLVSSFLYYSNWNPALDDYTIKDEFPVCNPPTWYFSASMQLIMLAPLVFLPLLRRPKLGLTLLLALLLLLGPLGTLAPYLISGRPTFLELTSHTSLTSMYAAYHQYTSSTGQYITSLLIGLLSGYLLVEKRRNGGWAALSGKTALQVLLSILSLVVIGLVFAWNNTFWVFNENFSTTSALAWYVSSKFLFTGAVACLTYIAAIASTGALKHLLRLVEPIGKLSTSILMLSVLTTLYRLTTHRHTYEMYFFQTIQNTIFDFVITTFVAFLLHLLFEGPAMRLAEIFESDQLFAGSMQGTGSFEELKPKNSRSSSEDSGEKSIEAVENTPEELKVGHSA